MKLILIAVLMLTATSAWAYWIPIGNALPNGGYVIYVDPSTIRRSGNMVKMWNLLDYKTAQVIAKSGRHLSQMAQAEYDCKEERVRVLYFSLHSEQMANGEIVYFDNKPGEWSPIPPSTINAEFWKIACGKK